MKTWLISISLLLAACAQVVPSQPYVDPYPAAEDFIWKTFLKADAPKPETQYVQQFCDTDHTIPGIAHFGLCTDGQFYAWDRIVVVEREQDTLPSNSFLCRGYMLAWFSPNVHDPNLNYDMFHFDNFFIWGASLDLCQEELKDYDYAAE